MIWVTPGAQAAPDRFLLAPKDSPPHPWGDPFVRLHREVYGRFLGEGRFGKRVSAMARAQGHHQHDALKHRHKHFHVTHYLHRGENWGHLLSTHTHEHNHPALDHVHIPHRDVEKEHRREAHLHDHARPAESPA